MKNKKLMLVAVAAMGLVAASTAGVGTAAWFKANSSVTAAGTANSESISVTDPTYTSTSATLPVVVTLTQVTNTGKTYQLATWDSSQLKGGYYDANGTNVTLVNAPKDSDHVFFKTYSIGIHVSDEYGTGTEYTDSNGDKWTSAQIVAALKTQTPTIALARASGSRAKFFGVGTSNPSAAQGAESVAATNGSAMTSLAAAANTSSDITIGYFGVYIEGSGQVDTEAVNGNFVVTIGSHA